MKLLEIVIEESEMFLNSIGKAIYKLLFTSGILVEVLNVSLCQHFPLLNSYYVDQT